MNVTNWVLVLGPRFFLGPPNLVVNSPNVKFDTSMYST